MKGSGRTWWLTAAILFIGLLQHGRTFVRAPDPINPDSPSYVEPATHLLREGRLLARDRVAYAVPPGSFPDGPLRADTIRTPVYPAIIAALIATGGSFRLLAALQHLLVLAMAAAAFGLLRSRFGDVSAFAAGVMIAVHPAAVDTANVLLTETVASAFVAAAALCFYVAQRRSAVPWAVASGLLFGVAALTRPIVLYAPVILAIVLLARRRPRAAAAFFVAAALLPAAWAWRNHRAAGVATVSSIEGENLLLYRAAGALTVAPKDVPDAVFALQKDFGYYREALRRRVPLVKEALDDARAKGWDVETMNHAQRSRFYARRGIGILVKHPFAYTEMGTSALIAMFVDDLSGIAAAHGAHIGSARLVLVPVSLLILICAVAGIAHLRRDDRDGAATLLPLLLYFALVSAGPEVEPRFIVTFLPLYAAAAGIGFGVLVSKLARGSD